MFDRTLPSKWRQRLELRSFLLGGVVLGSVITSTLLVLIGIENSPIILSKFLYAILVFLLLFALWYLLSGRNRLKSIFGADHHTIGEFSKKLSSDIRHGRGSNIARRFGDIATIYSNIQVRFSLIQASILLLGAISVLITASYIIKQTKVMTEQTQVMAQQTQAITNQTNTIFKLGEVTPVYDLYSSSNPDVRRDNFFKILQQGKKRINGAEVDHIEYREDVRLSCSRCDLKAARFVNNDMRESRFDSARLHLVTFLNVNLESANFSNSTISVDLMNGITGIERKYLFAQSFRKSNLKGAVFRRATITGLEFRDQVVFDGTVFSSAQLTGVKFVKARLNNVSLLRTKIRESEFIEMDMSRTGRFGIDSLEMLVDNTFSKVNLSGVNFTNIGFFRGNKFEGSDLSGANFSGLDLVGTSFKGTEISRTNFKSAVNVNFDDALLNGSPCNTQIDVCNALLK